jgi:hypothetical protein
MPSMLSPSNGVYGLLREVLDELEGPDVDGGDGAIGGGVTEIERGMTILIRGRPG